MFSSIEDAWGSGFRETREMFQAKPVIYAQHKEHFCPSCQARYEPISPPSSIKTITTPLDDHFITASLVGMLVLVVLSVLEK
jgi:hypothetical protein